MRKRCSCLNVTCKLLEKAKYEEKDGRGKEGGMEKGKQN